MFISVVVCVFLTAVWNYIYFILVLWGRSFSAVDRKPENGEFNEANIWFYKDQLWLIATTYLWSKYIKTESSDFIAAYMCIKRMKHILVATVQYIHQENLEKVMLIIGIVDSAYVLQEHSYYYVVSLGFM